jgi:hypothetical protein
MEALVWNTSLRKQRGVGVGGNNVGLLIVQTTKRDYIASVEEVGVGLFARATRRNIPKDGILQVLWTLFMSGILIRKHNVLETGSVSICREGEREGGPLKQVGFEI